MPHTAFIVSLWLLKLQTQDTHRQHTQKKNVASCLSKKKKEYEKNLRVSPPADRN